ncbi:hypothetical protein JAAARDRAFT_192446 [Jaapia argillacea MUCL 33604]|uniref:Xylose isomerase-like TIM barrel domain-containing protein n=1 Tax=Jaapia argillacea MUCL 33604 TaxID=933084 RepID=A0A067PYB9_9AGAM|nr:hypothetical protein JAAARDRAFT_192446 [Jaapia argillacea MUCL 33604]
MSSLQSIQTAYCTDSAGMHPSHTLPIKLRAIAAAGFSSVEIAFPNLEAYAKQQHQEYQKIDNSGRGDVEVLCKVARKVRGMCEELGLEVLALHPFSQFEGYEDVSKREEGFARAQTWFKVMNALNCQMLQVGSSNDPSISSDYEIIARDLRQLADEAAAQEPPIRIAYEMWAWGVHVNTWEDTWDICQRVDRPNFGLCLDTFQICARAYADPTSPSGLLTNPPASLRLTHSLTHLTSSLAPHKDKIFYLQISDATRSSPSHIASPHVAASFGVEELKEEAKNGGRDVLYVWSDKWRPLPFMEEGYGGYLPVGDVVRAVLETGWRGPWSYEVFYEKEMGKDDPSVPNRWTRAARKSHERLVEELGKKVLD